MKRQFTTHRQIEAIRQDDKLKEQVIEKIRKTDKEKLSAIVGANPEDLPADLDQQVETFLQPEGVSTGHSRLMEAIVLATGRPVFFVKNGTPELTGDEVELWHDAINQNLPTLEKNILSVGRIEGKNHPQFTWFGTGWLIRDDLIVTNRHVAELFSANRNGNLVFRTFFTGQVIPRIDFLAELDSESRNESDEHEIVRPIYIAAENEPDVAIFQVNWRNNPTKMQPLQLSNGFPETKDKIAVIGYPARDSRARLVEDMERIFGGVYDVKRLAPGEITNVWTQHNTIEHNATTLGGNSGSVIVSLDSGEALGLHFAGAEQRANYGVTASYLRKLIDRLPSRFINGFSPSTSTALPASGLSAPATFANELVSRNCKLSTYTKKQVPSFKVSGRFVAYASPDSTYAVTRRMFEKAQQSILIGIYDFSARHMVELIIGALERGIRVSLMLDIDSKKEKDVFDELRKLGVRCVPAPSCASARSNYFASSHEKVIVIDNRWTLIQSGNYSNNSIPFNESDGATNGGSFRFGNRDMGIAIESVALAKFFTGMLESDMDLELNPQTPSPEFAESPLPDFDLLIEAPKFVPEPLFPSQSFQNLGNVKVQPVLTPDNYMEEVPKLLRSAKRRICIEQQYIKHWQPNVKALCEAIQEARGDDDDFEVQIIVARPLSRGDEFEREMDGIRKLRDDFGFDVRLLSPQHFVHCHNKLIIVDEEKVLISSQNWSDYAVVRNREVGVIVYDENITQYYAQIFAADWTMSDGVIEEVPMPMLSGNLESFATERRLIRLDAADIQNV